MRTIAIIGGGATGVLAATQLLRASDSVRVELFEPAAELGGGIAYGTQHPGHVLNVPAAGMSALPDEPGHFLAWLERQEPWWPDEDGRPQDFAPRRLYRRYLQSLLLPWMDAELPRLRHHRVTVTDLQVLPGSLDVRGADGRSWTVDAAILATGNAAGPATSGGQRLDYWSNPSGFDLPQDAPVAILGTGLSMIDSVISLLGHGHTGPITAISRHGLIPRAHAEAPPSSAAPPLPQDRTLAGLMRWMQRHRRIPGVDWRQLVASLRPESQRIWGMWSVAEKSRFLRHARAWWDVHRHRVAPGIHTWIESACRSGQLRILAGRVVEDRSTERGQLVIQPRGTNRHETVSARHVIDCRGQGGEHGMMDNPLLGRLIEAGVARPAFGGLGLEVSPDCAVLDSSGQASRRLFSVGPPTAGTFWEITAIPDIRVQVRDLARRLAADCTAEEQQGSSGVSLT